MVDPVGVGTRCAAPISLPFSSGITRPIAFAAPVLFGTIFTAPARASSQITLSLRSVKDHLIACVSMDGAHDTGLDRQLDRSEPLPSEPGSLLYRKLQK